MGACGGGCVGLITGSTEAKYKSQLPFCLAASGSCCGVLRGEQARGWARSRAVGSAPAAQRSCRAGRLEKERAEARAQGAGCPMFVRPTGECLPWGQAPPWPYIPHPHDWTHYVDIPHGYMPPPPC